MQLWQAASLGVVQGLTEFLPVSSSGHLVLAGWLLGMDAESAGLTFAIVAHVGTALAVLTVYVADILDLLRRALAGGPSEGSRQARRYLLALIVASVPAALAGALFKDTVAACFDRPLPVAVALLVTGFILYSADLRAQATGRHTPIRWPQALLVGLAQAFAIFPGISRSGATIATGLHAGVPRLEAARFSFLLSVPVILGAALLDLAGSPPEPAQLGSLLVGGLLAFASGLLAIKLVLAVLSRGRLRGFAYYCWGLSVLTMTLLALGV